MKILHLSAASESTGAGKATKLLHNSLEKSGVHSRILFLKSSYTSENIISFDKINLKNFLIRYLYTWLDKLFLLFYRNKMVLFSPGLFGHNLHYLSCFLWADVIHIHWSNHGFIDIKDLKKWNKPIVWTLRDMWLFTGGCHYSFDCMKYITTCGKCFILNSSSDNDLSRLIMNRKLYHFQSIKNLQVVAISSWLKESALKSKLLSKSSIDIIFSGVDTNKFILKNKRILRSKFNISENKKIILIGAADLREKYKGFDFILKLLSAIDDKFLIFTFGSSTFKKNEIKQNFIHFGYCSNELLNELYSVSDLFLSPSIVEAFGKTFLEAQLCGCPVLCFANTGPADIIAHKSSGYLANYNDFDDLLFGFNFCMQSNFDSNYIRNRLLPDFDINYIAKKYVEIYEKMYLDWSSRR